LLASGMGVLLWRRRAAAPLALLLLLIASPAFADPIECFPADGCVRLPLVSAGLTNRGIEGVSAGVVTSAFSGVATDSDHGSIGIQLGPAGSTVHIVLPVGGTGLWTYQGQTYRELKVDLSNQNFYAGWFEQAIITVVLGVDVDTAPATFEGRVNFFNFPQPPVSFAFTGTGTAQLVTTTSPDGNLQARVLSAVFGPTVVTPEPATWILLGSGFVALAFARRKLST
jgi:hypothetical protein